MSIESLEQELEQIEFSMAELDDKRCAIANRLRIAIAQRTNASKVLEFPGRVVVELGPCPNPHL